VWVHSWIFLPVLVAIRVFAPFSCAWPSDAGTDFCGLGPVLDSTICADSFGLQFVSPASVVVQRAVFPLLDKANGVSPRHRLV
jgi:hypothetical protein